MTRITYGTLNADQRDLLSDCTQPEGVEDPRPLHADRKLLIQLLGAGLVERGGNKWHATTAGRVAVRDWTVAP